GTNSFAVQAVSQSTVGFSATLWADNQSTDPNAVAGHFQVATQSNNLITGSCCTGTQTTVFSVNGTGQISNTVPTGNPPLVVTSTTPVANLTASNHPTVFNNTIGAPVTNARIVA